MDWKYYIFLNDIEKCCLNKKETISSKKYPTYLGDEVERVK